MFLMGKSWESLFWETILALTCIGAVIIAAFILNLPAPYNPYRADLIEEENFSDADKKNPGSGYGYFAKHRGTNKSLKAETSVTVLVLGDIGRSPRMQYHVASIAKHGGKVSLIGYVESEVLPEVKNNRFVRIIPLKPIPERLRTSSTLMFPIIAPLKALFQLWSVWKACGYQTKPTKWMLVQNPPSIPTLLIAQFVCFIRNTRLIIDWHNFGYTILALKLGENHPLVKISEVYEQYVARYASAHFCVTNAMARVLKQKYGVEALPLHDRPTKQFQPLTSTQRHEVLHRLDGTTKHAKQILNKEWRLLVSSTSWTADEDFGMLLDALVAYSATVSMDRRYPKILAIITGKGPQKDYYLKQIQKLKDNKSLSNVSIKTAWLSLEDYASLLGAADVGVSLHKSSSGVDLPMKVVDMFGAGLPVFGYGKFESWKELVKDGVNGMSFEKASELDRLLERGFSGKGDRMEVLREGAMKETKLRWDDQWFPIAGKLLKMSGTTVDSEPRQHVEEDKATYSFMKSPEQKQLDPRDNTAVSSAYERAEEKPVSVQTVKENINTTLFGESNTGANPSSGGNITANEENGTPGPPIKDKISTTLFGESKDEPAPVSVEQTNETPDSAPSLKDKITTTLFGESNGQTKDVSAPIGPEPNYETTDSVPYSKDKTTTTLFGDSNGESKDLSALIGPEQHHDTTDSAPSLKEKITTTLFGNSNGESKDISAPIGPEQNHDTTDSAPSLKDKITATLFGDQKTTDDLSSVEQTHTASEPTYTTPEPTQATSEPTHTTSESTPTLKEKITTTLFGESNKAPALSSADQTHETNDSAPSLKDKITATLFGENKTTPHSHDEETTGPVIEAPVPTFDKENTSPIQRPATPPPASSTIFSQPVTSAREEQPQTINDIEYKTGEPIFPVASTAGQPGGTFLSYR